MQKSVGILRFSNFKKFAKQKEKPVQIAWFSNIVIWWEWVDSNHLSRKTTDLQSAPALQLRRTPRTFLSAFAKASVDTEFSDLACASVKIRGASRGNRTLISSLEGLHSSL